jgi:hypothetical protein
LMSYALGGIGLPHLDVGGAEMFFRALVKLLPEARQDLQELTARPGGFHYDAVRAEGGVCASNPSAVVLMTDLNGEAFKHDAATFDGAPYCDRSNPARKTNVQAWQRLRHWCRIALRRRDMQAWIINDWISSVWAPAYNEVMERPHGTFREAFILARIWNTSRGSALAALGAAGTKADPRDRVAAELADYARRSRTHQQRVPVMQRPGVVYDFLAGVQMS